MNARKTRLTTVSGRADGRRPCEWRISDNEREEYYSGTLRNGQYQESASVELAHSTMLA
jgi:hypothetical protein